MELTQSCLVQAPEIQTMYSVPLPVSALRTRIRQEFERHRNVNKLDVTDVLITKATIDYQVRLRTPSEIGLRV